MRVALSRRWPQNSGRLAYAFMSLLLLGTSARAQVPDDLRAELAALRAEQDRIIALQQTNEAALQALETRLQMQGEAERAAAAMVTATPASAYQTHDVTEGSRWSVTGDLRLRAQLDSSDADAPSRDSTQLRARIGASYRHGDRLSLVARLVTGDPDDPNSTDVQLANWVDDLQVSLDLAYLQFKLNGATLYAGKFPQLFVRTDLLWDGDVNPQGLGATVKKSLRDGSSVRAAAAALQVDEQSAGPESTMVGLQIGYDSATYRGWKFDVSGSHYRYQLGSMAGADAGDFRSNTRNVDGSYASEFELSDVIAGATWQGDNARWPLRFVADVTRNHAAHAGRDTAYGIDVVVGRTSQPGDWRIAYGHAVAEVDSVLAAFSHDNLSIATNYRLHSLTFDYTPTPKAVVGAIWYKYRPKDPAFAGTNNPADWLDRFRLYYLLHF